MIPDVVAFFGVLGIHFARKYCGLQGAVFLKDKGCQVAKYTQDPKNSTCIVKVGLGSLH